MGFASTWERTRSTEAARPSASSGRSGLESPGTHRPSPGRSPSTGESYGLPTGALSLALTGLLPARAKLEAAAGCRASARSNAKLARTPVAAWLDQEVRDPVLRAMLEALFRLTSYTNAPGRMSAGAALAQLAFSSSQGVVYVDGGWQGLVDALFDAARRSAADVRTSASVIRAERRADGWSVRCDGGADVHCHTLVVAAGPRTAASLVDSKALDGWAATPSP